MKKLFIIFATIFLTASVFAQSPQKMSYQAVVRNSSSVLVTNQTIGMQISILQGSASGTAVYVETQTPTTNANGLVSLEIGSGTLVSGTFATIDWANGQYFIKTETDPTGGTNYSITGSSQLLSVPYALYAGSSNDLPTGTIGQTLRHDGSEWISDTLIKNNGTNVGISADPLSGTKLYIYRSGDDFGPNLSGIYSKRVGAIGATSGGTSWTPSGIDAAIKGYSYYGNNYTAGVAGYSYLDYDKSTGVIGGSADGSLFGALAYKESSSLSWAGYFSGNAKVTGTLSITGGLPGAGKVLTSDANGNATWTTPTSTTHYVGESYGGGIVFYVYDNGQHGLIAATTDQSTGIQWYNGTNTTTNAVRDGIGAGMYNTERIIANQGTGSYAAQLCANYQGGGYGDWYLPSKYELNLLYLQKVAVGGFVLAYYWSSTEDSSTNAWRQFFDGGYQGVYSKVTFGNVRAVRAF